MTLHVHRVPTYVMSTGLDREPRWCFYCRKRVKFWRTIRGPSDPLSYYGPHVEIECERGHLDGDCFPGTVREWSE